MGRCVNRQGVRDPRRDRNPRNSINEDEFGCDGAVLNFPNVQSCSTITVLGIALGVPVIGGIHYTISTAPKQLKATIHHLMRDCFQISPNGGIINNWCRDIWQVGNIKGYSNGDAFASKYPAGKGMRRKLRKWLCLNKEFPIHSLQKNANDVIYYSVRLMSPTTVYWSYSENNSDGPYHAISDNSFNVVPRIWPKRN